MRAKFLVAICATVIAAELPSVRMIECDGEAR
jgi:hypothetical protein